PEWAEWMDAAARFRRAVRNSELQRAEQEERFNRFFAETIDTQKITARVPTAKEEASWLGKALATRPTIETLAHDLPQPGIRGKKVGFVSLVGAGPGDAGLLTLRGRQRLLAADVVVYDRLAATVLPCDLKQDVELHCVGKTADHHPVPQGEINALLVRLAREGKRVVRLKGGDPFVFGRGGEEAEAFHEAGISFEIIPCVTAGIAVPAYAGIPVTHRAEVVRLTMVTAHESKKTKGPQVRWDLLGKDPHATLVGYMGVTSLPDVIVQLLAAGMDPKTPAAVVERGTTSRQRVVRSTLSELPEATLRNGLKPPAVFVIGPAVGHAEKLDWFCNRPLFGERVGIFSPTGELGETMELSGVEVVEVPLSVSPAARVVMGALPLTGWVLRSVDEVDAIDEERDGLGWGANVVAWCTQPDAAMRAKELGWEKVEEIKGPVTGGVLVEAMCKRHVSSK
ncbi:MAG: uroporphyrinogen-III C-methyltransferase, partial [Pseudomonadota bacterium]